jgi:mutator protein MutT
MSGDRVQTRLPAPGLKDMTAKIVDAAVGVLVERRDGARWVLITRRMMDRVYGGYWEFPGGKVEDGETAAQCLVREFREELGLRIEVEAALPTVEHTYAHGRVRLHPFYCRRAAADPGNPEALQEPRDLQVMEHRWVLAGQLGGFAFPEANAGLIEMLVSGRVQ